MLEESNWQNDKLHGFYRSYFQDGKTYLEYTYSEGLRNGSFKTWFPDGSRELEGFYLNAQRHGKWNYFDVTGKLLYTLNYDQGKLLNPEVQDSIEREKAGQYKSKEEKIPDPEKFMQNPEEYMQLMKTK